MVEAEAQAYTLEKVGGGKQKIAWGFAGFWGLFCEEHGSRSGDHNTTQ